MLKTGSANGDLARHTLLRGNGFPMFTQRTVVFEQVDIVLSI